MRQPIDPVADEIPPRPQSRPELRKTRFVAIQRRNRGNL